MTKFNADQEAAFREYESTKTAINELEEFLAKLKPVVLGAIPEGAEVKGESGTFFVQQRKSWVYSDSVERSEEQLKTLKSEEQAKGIAKATDVPILMYRRRSAE